MPYFTDPVTGELYFEDEEDNPMGVNPGIGIRRARELLARLPDAELAGFRGPGVVPPGTAPGISHQPIIIQPKPTFRPLNGADQNNRGNAAQLVLANIGVASVDNGPFQVPGIVQSPQNPGQDAEVIGVQLGLDLPPEFFDPTNDWANIALQFTGIIEWGVGGASFSAEVDWNQGVYFAVNASWIRISARVEQFRTGLAPATTTITFKASLSYGDSNTVNTSSPCRLTKNLVGLAVPILGAGADSLQVSIPRWATGFTIIDAGGVGAGNEFAAPNYGILVERANGAWTAVYKMTDRSNTARQIEGQYPIPPDGRFLVLRNNGVIGMASPKVMFNLAF